MAGLHIKQGNVIMKKLIVALTCFVSAPVMAQQSDINRTQPQISIGSRAEVKVNPDRARIQVSVHTRAVTAAAAATENATKQKAVIDALRALGLRENEISTVGYNVSPEHRYEQNREPVIIGYNVTNTVSVELRDLSLVGRVIDVAISKGANMITSLNFYASNTDEARREAIAAAVQKARLDADATARAAGGTIGGLLEVSVGAYFPPPIPVEFSRISAQAKMADTPINPGEQTVSVDVSTRWSFIPAR
jgi:uncharacterized protein